ncbi:pilin N-terminal domain-containing protein [Lactococcus formosensis]|uniref:pilin N-terminal domain-containing protein n=1 Tax=Lactococcus formosensis TaxID=1281486 RepID=UPI0024348F46|nr:pilin N-terminal domain-containing protein [Lactococcus formosensis]MDG6166504.1 pilin N-terminal domain-containing protein [Lactococcus formosensis]MDG6173005.1 pilin N-terminal domain-containing protein [Lactococcus formosensis]
MKKYIFTLIAALLALLSFGFGQNVAAQEDTGSYGIHIIKYNLNDSQESQLTHDGTPVTSGTEDLQRLAGVQYTITRMTKTEMNIYVTAQGADAFSQTITTNAQGEAELTGLPRGVYQVTESKSEQVPTPMSPVLVSLPMQNANGLINEVYIYPKSSMVLPDTPQIPDANVPDKLPDTSGNIGSYQIIIAMISVIVLVGFSGLWWTKKAHE